MAAVALTRFVAPDHDNFERRHHYSLLSKSCPAFDKTRCDRPTSASSVVYQNRKRGRLNEALRASEGQLASESSRKTETRVVHPPRSRPATAGSSAVWGLSHETQVQNNKAEKVEARLQEYGTTKCAARGAITPKAKIFEPPVSVNSHFEEDLKFFEGELTEMGRRIRLDGVMDDKTAKIFEEERRRAEEKRLREEAQRHLRQAAKEAQNPKKRVLLRVEEQRQNMQAGEAEFISIASKVPMKNYEGAFGSDSVPIPLVDVEMLQTKALGLNGAGTFNKIYGLACDRAKRLAWEAEVYGTPESRPNHVKLNSTPGGSSVMSRSRSLLHSRQSQKTARNEERQLSAQLKKREHHQKKTLQLMTSMRSCIDMNESMCCNCDTLKALKSITHQVAQAHMKGNLEELSGSLKKRAISRHSTQTNLSLLSQQSLRTPRFWWGVLRGVLFVLCLLAARRRKWAGVRVRNFCLRLQQHDKIKRAVRIWNIRVRRLAAIVRVFMARKAKWYNRVSRDWERLEDSFLSTSYNKNPFGLQANMEKSLSPAELAEYSSDERWKALRIPVKHRKLALGRWYFLQLRKKVRSQTGWASTVGDTMTQKTDLQRFFELCGFDVEQEEAENPSPKSYATCNVRGFQPKYQSQASLRHRQSYANIVFEIREQELMEMITTLARSLRDVSPFQLHPCNAMPQKRKPRKRMSRFFSNHSNMGDTAHSATHSESDYSSKVKETAEEQCDLDLEELFCTFTPRLHEMREAHMVNGRDAACGETEAFWREDDEAAIRLIREADMHA